MSDNNISKQMSVSSCKHEGGGRDYAFDRTNFLLMAIGFAIVIIGFVLMSGAGSDEQAYNPDIFSVRRIKVAPVVCFIGFISLIYAIIRKPKH